MDLLPKNRQTSVNKNFDPKHAEDRRKALKAIGKFGLYTAPALLALLESGRARASTCSIDNPRC
jgi:hypothetical protein